ncbi:GGDEF domain-containing response regulator [Zarconia navalis]|uniref:GGDEF domain-containing response regulator n=1 Tax=Zarconia navalis TaxID=2992134 RepID=UPI0021F91861|nr:diguanylate cyclase [Zarconia navalis]
MLGSDEIEPTKVVLVVDDRPINLEILSTMLKAQGYRVCQALSGQMALTAARTVAPDAILLDVQMPEMDGYEVCSALKASERTAHIPIIFLGQVKDGAEIVRAFATGGVDYLPQPLRLVEVVARIENHLSARRLQHQLQAQTQQLESQNLQLQQAISDALKAEVTLAQTNQQLENLARFDSLTQLLNRRGFDERLEREWRRCARERVPLALLLIDIDYFKLYNDTYGHPAGDLCLRQVSDTLRRSIKRPGDVVARYGGEEFTVLLPKTTLEGSVCVAQRIQQAVRNQAIAHSGSPAESCLTLSCGVASQIPDSSQLPTTLIDDADRALYAAKAQGRDRVVPS